MFWSGVYKIGRVTAPILVHYLVNHIIVIVGIGGLHIADAALWTSATAVLLLPLFAWMYRADGNPYGEHKINAQACLLIALLGVACNLVLTYAENLLLFRLRLNLPNTAQEALFQSNFWIQIIGVGMIVPAMEETLFRGLVYKRLRGYTKTAWSAILLSAALFAVYHGNLIQILFAFPMGIILAAIYEKRQTLKAPVLFHMSVNISSILLTAFG